MEVFIPVGVLVLGLIAGAIFVLCWVWDKAQTDLMQAQKKAEDAKKKP